MLTLKGFKTIQLRVNEKTKDIIKILGIYTDELDGYQYAKSRMNVRNDRKR